MDVGVEAQGSPFVFLIVAVRMTTQECLVYALPRQFFVRRNGRLAILSHKQTAFGGVRHCCADQVYDRRHPSCVLPLIVRVLE